MVSNMIDLRRRPCSQSATLRYCIHCSYLSFRHAHFVLSVPWRYTQTMICGYFLRFLIPSPSLWTIFPLLQYKCGPLETPRGWSTLFVNPSLEKVQREWPTTHWYSGNPFDSKCKVHSIIWVGQNVIVKCTTWYDYYATIFLALRLIGWHLY